MGKVIRRVIAILLCATALILAVLPAGTAEATSTHGDYEYDGATVAKYLGSESEVTLPAWVNRVGKEAFEGYDKMTKLVMPDTVTTVDFGAFSNCSNLQTVRMSESVRTLGSSAFSGCTNLYSVSVPRTVRDIGSGVFAGCPSLSNVSVSPANENYTSYDGVIYSKDGKKLVQYLAGRPSTTYKMPSAVREIEEYAFWGANNLSKLSITYGVDKIPEYAFSNCKGLQHVTLPRSVQSIFAYAFEDCDSLSYINIPDSVGYIDDRAFANTRGALLRFIDKNGNVVKTFNSEDVEKYGNGTAGAPVVNQPDYMTGNNSDSANGANNVTDQANVISNDPTALANGSTTYQDGTASDSAENSGSNASAAGSNGSTTYIDDGTEGIPQTFDPTNVTPLDPGDEVSVDGANGAADATATATGNQSSAPSNIAASNDQYNNGYYKASDSGSNPWDTQIEYRDFENNMTGYDLGAGKVLGGSVVLRMSSKQPVKGLNFPNAEYEDTMMDTAASTPKSDSDVIGDTFASYSGNEGNVSVPAGVKTIGNRAFYKNQDLKGVTLPSGITDIGEFAFARSGLTDISLPEGTKNIDYAAFYMCPDLTNVGIPSSVDSIALGAFSGTPFIENWKSVGENDYLVVGDGVLLAYKGHDKRVFIPDSIKHIAAGAFSGNDKIESLTIPSSVEDIGEEAFRDCSNLHELIMGEGLKNIGDRAFKNSGLSVVSLPDSLEGIGLAAFDNGGILKTVILNGPNVPNVTYDKSATRLSAKDLRACAFEGAENAIVSNTCDLSSGTLFDPRFYGFEGDVYSIGSGENKTLVLERALTKPDSSGNVVLNQQVEIAGDTYMLDHVKSNAFDNYRDWSNWADNKPVSVSVNGERSEALDSLLADVNSNILAAGENEDTEADPNRSNITISLDGKRFPTRGSAYANIPGDTDKYSVSINEDETARNMINTAFLHSGEPNPENFVPLSVDMYDKSGTVPIHKLGNSKMELSIPVPSGMENDEGIGIASLDENGLLENLSSEITDDGTGKNIKFVAGHFSTYVIYSRGKAATLSYDADGNPIETIDDVGAASGTFDMSGTWQSLNKKVYGPLSPKWFIIIIMLALALILFIYKPTISNNNRKGG